MWKYAVGSLLAVVIGFLADAVFGDPQTALHPICLIGNLIAWLENGWSQKRTKSAGVVCIWKRVAGTQKMTRRERRHCICREQKVRDIRSPRA